MRDAGIAHRDILAVHRTPQAINGQIVVARLGDEATVKYYHRRGSLLRLEPANPEFAPLEIDLRRETCEIEGIVVGIVRTELHAPQLTESRCDYPPVPWLAAHADARAAGTAVPQRRVRPRSTAGRALGLC